MTRYHDACLHPNICKFFSISPSALPVANPVAASITSFNERLCAQVEACRPIYDAAQPNTLEYKHGLYLPKDHIYHQIRPLFRALLIFIDSSKDYHLEDSNMRVSLVRTGIEQGLSAPISFEAIRGKAGTETTDNPNVVTTTLQRAVDFVITLENREHAASPFVTAPAAKYLRVWKAEFGDEPVLYPSSKLVTDENAAEWGWCGESEHLDSQMVAEEQRIRETVTTMFLGRAWYPDGYRPWPTEDSAPSPWKTVI